jgi:hypothetical protein
MASKMMFLFAVLLLGTAEVLPSALGSRAMVPSHPVEKVILPEMSKETGKYYYYIVLLIKLSVE